MRFERVYRALDEGGLIVNDLNGEILGQRGLNILQPRLEGIGSGYGTRVTEGLPFRRAAVTGSSSESSA